MKKTYITPTTDNFIAWLCEDGTSQPGLANGSITGGDAPARMKNIDLKKLYV